MDQAIEALILALTVYLPLAFGGTPLPAHAPAMIAAMALLALVAYRAALDVNKQPTGALSMVLPSLVLGALFLIFIGSDVVPVPRPLARFFAFRGIVGEGWLVPRHFAPIEAWRELLSWVVPFALFLAVVTTYRTRSQVRRLLQVVAVVGLFEAGYGLVEWVSGHQHIFGFEKRAYVDVATGTFINRNHYAGYLEMTIGLLFGGLFVTYAKEKSALGLRTGGTEHLLALGFAIVLCLGAIVASGSRAAIASLAFAMALVGATLVSHRQRRNFVFVIAALSFVAVLFSMWLGTDELPARYAELTQDVRAGDARPRVYLATLKMIADAPFYGVGAGGFADAFAFYRPAGLLAHYDYVHSDPLEILAETGLFGASALYGAIAFALIVVIRERAKRHSRFARGQSLGLLISAAALLAHSLVDFPFGIPATRAAFFTLLAAGVVVVQRRLER
ncbi:MAG: O-antigen ligase family protein [Deltaproteobacteria bacterium]|nr:O-antigen ligase family protein [Deltaproteobacteria bacterium]